MFALCDEAYALITALDEQALSSRRILWTQFGLHLSWVAGATAGDLAGASFLSGLKGLDFVLIAMFLVLTIDTYRSAPIGGARRSPSRQPSWHWCLCPARWCSWQCAATPSLSWPGTT